MDKLIIYSQGIIAMSVCVDKDLTTHEIEMLANSQSPTGIKSKWQISTDKTFHKGEPNPCPCEDHPETRKHYLLNC